MATEFSLADEYTAIYRSTANTHPSPRSLFDYVHPGFASGKFRIGFALELDNDDRYTYTLAPLVFSTLLIIAEQVLGYPKADAVFPAFRMQQNASLDADPTAPSSAASNNFPGS